MSNIKMSQMAEATNINDIDYIPIVQNGVNKIIKKEKMFNDIEEAINIPEGTKLSNNTSGHTNQYLKLLTLDMGQNQYKASSVLFVFSDVQSAGLYNSVFELAIYRGSNDAGITKLKLTEKIRGGINSVNPERNVAKNLVAVKENDKIVSLYYKPITVSETPIIKILSYQSNQKYGELLTIAEPETYSDELPSGTQYTCRSSGNIDCGSITITPDAANVPKAGHVTFNKAFTKAPHVTATAQSAAPGTSVLGVAVKNITTTGCEIYLTRTDTTASTVEWIAVEPE